MDKLEQTLRICHSKSPAPDTIPYSSLLRYIDKTTPTQHIQPHMEKGTDPHRMENGQHNNYLKTRKR